MEFRNNGEDVKVRIEEEGGYRWMTVKANEIVDLSEEVGLTNKFEKLEPKVDEPEEPEKDEPEEKEKPKRKPKKPKK